MQLVIDASFTFFSTLFVSSKGAISVSLLIVLFGLYQYFKRFKRRLNPIEGELDNAIGLLGKFESRQDFYENFEDFKEDITKIPEFGKVWCDFHKTLIIPRKNEGCHIFYTKPVASYFVLNELGINNTIAGRINSIPGTLTGLGILGTFVGLSCGIYLAQDGLTAGDTLKVTESLGQLLSGASLAFFSSIAGLLASMVFAWRKYKNLDRFEDKIRSFCKTLSSLMIFKSEESLLYDELCETKKQTDSLSRFSTDLAVNIGKALEEKVTGNLIPLMEKLIVGVDNLSNKQSEVGSAAIEQASKAMNENMVSQMGSQMNLLGETFSNLFATLERSSAMITDGQSEIQNQSQNMANSVKLALDDSAEILKSKFNTSLEDFSLKVKEATESSVEDITSAISSISQSLNESFDRAQSTTSKVEKTINLLLEFSEVQKRSNDSIHEVVGKLGETSHILSQTGEPIEAATQMLSESIVIFAPLLQNLAGVSKDISKNAFLINEANDELGKVWQNYQERFETVDDSLRNAFEEITDGLAGYTENIQNFHVKLDESVAKIVTQLAGAVSEFGVHIDDLTDVMSKNKEL